MNKQVGLSHDNRLSSREPSECPGVVMPCLYSFSALEFVLHNTQTGNSISVHLFVREKKHMQVKPRPRTKPDFPLSTS